MSNTIAIDMDPPESDLDYWKRAAERLDGAEGPVPSRTAERAAAFWYLDTDNVARLVRWMAGAGADADGSPLQPFGDPRDGQASLYEVISAVADVFEHPWAYAAQWDGLQRNLTFARFVERFQTLDAYATPVYAAGEKDPA